MAKCILLPLLLFLSGCASLPSEWDDDDRRRSMAIYATLAADAVTTERIQDHAHLVEGGPIASRVLGDDPDTAETLAYMAALAFTYRAIAKRLPEKWRRRVQYFLIADHAYAVAKNCRNDLC